ncbi:MAG: hypothetical protein IK088_01775 [Lachnospiraceae bacterium]|nr:hypothetical protein [Lachnospiraceae bacterium]
MLFAYFLQISNHMWISPDYDRKPWSNQDVWNENNNIDIDVFDELVDFMAARFVNGLVIDVGDGVKLDSHPEIAAPDAWSKEFLKKKLDALRAKGIEPLPKLNFSCGHNMWMKDWQFRVGSPEYDQFCKDCIREVSELFGKPRFFHLGLDEESPVQKHKAIAVYRHPVEFWRFANEMFRTVEECGSRPWVFSDYYWHHPDVFEKNMPRSVVQSNWHYGQMNPTPRDSSSYTAVITYNKLEELGYDQIPVPSHFCNALNANQVLDYCKEVISPEHLLGFNDIPWHNTTRREKYTHMADIDRFYLARVKHFPETLPADHKIIW